MKKYIDPLIRCAFVTWLLLNIAIGAAPQIRAFAPPSKINDISLSAYIKVAKGKFGENIFVSAFATAVYPGALFGAWVNNSMLP